MKKIAMISTYCDTDEKKTVLRDNILKLKSLNVDVMVLSPLVLGDDIVSLCDFFYYTKENPILRWPERANSFWWKSNNRQGDEIILHRDIDDYGWAALYQTKKLSQIAMSYDYEIFYHMIYDLEISEFIINDIQKNVINKTYHRINPKDPNDKWDVTLHFMIFDRQSIESFEDKIDKNTYLNLNGFAEEYVEEIVSDMRLKKSEYDVKDKIRYIDADDDDIFNYSFNTKYKIFFSNLDDFITVIFYNIDCKNIHIIINGCMTFIVDEMKPIYLKGVIIESFKVICDNDTDEYINTINKIKRNIIELKKI